MFTMEEKTPHGEYAIVIENDGSVSVSVNGSEPRIFATAALAIGWAERMIEQVKGIPLGAVGYGMAIEALEDWLDDAPVGRAAESCTLGALLECGE